MISLATIATLATAFTGTPCAAIDNGPNMAAFAVPGRAAIVRHYSDMGGDNGLAYDGPVPKRAWAASRAAERALQIGEPGHKRRIVCR